MGVSTVPAIWAVAISEPWMMCPTGIMLFRLSRLSLLIWILPLTGAEVILPLPKACRML